MKLSVIIPVYNTAAYLRRCLDSVINQTMRDIEIILASDGPEDCDAICREYAAEDSRIKLIERPGSYGAVSYTHLPGAGRWRLRPSTG